MPIIRARHSCFLKPSRLALRYTSSAEAPCSFMAWYGAGSWSTFLQIPIKSYTYLPAASGRSGNKRTLTHLTANVRSSVSLLHVRTNITQPVEGIGPALHHLAPGRLMLGAVVGASVRVFDGMRQLVLDQVDTLP